MKTTRIQRALRFILSMMITAAITTTPLLTPSRSQLVEGLMASTALLRFSMCDLPPAPSAHLHVPQGPQICEDGELRRKRHACKQPNSVWKLRALRGFAESSSQRALTHSRLTRDEGFIYPCWALTAPPQLLRVVRKLPFVPKCEFKSCLIHYC